MSAITLRLMNRLSYALKPEEREPVCGDLIESGDFGIRVILNLLGLIFRRRANSWRQVRPWSVLLLAVIPLTWMLCLLTRRTSDWTSINAWFYVNNWTLGYLADGFRSDLVLGLKNLSLSYLELACWSWTAGLVLGYLSRQTAVLFFALLLAAELLLPHHRSLPNAEVFYISFYASILPLLLLAVLVLIPAFKGITASHQHPFSISLLLCVLTTLLSLMAGSLWRSTGYSHLYLAMSMVAPLAWQILNLYEKHQPRTLNPS